MFEQRVSAELQRIIGEKGFCGCGQEHCEGLQLNTEMQSSCGLFGLLVASYQCNVDCVIKFTVIAYKIMQILLINIKNRLSISSELNAERRVPVD